MAIPAPLAVRATAYRLALAAASVPMLVQAAVLPSKAKAMLFAELTAVA
jgi:hypothetical protein